MEGDQILEALRNPSATSHPVDVGLRTEAAVVAHLLRLGVKVLEPNGFNHRYDLVLDLDGEFVRAQIKTGRLRDRVVVFKTCSVRSNTRGAARRAYEGEIEVFLVHCADTGGTYAVPTDQAPRGEMRLRIAETANCQTVGIRWASEYAVPA